MNRSESSPYSFSFFCVNFVLLKIYSSNRSKDKSEIESLAPPPRSHRDGDSIPLQYSVILSELGVGAAPLRESGPPLRPSSCLLLGKFWGSCSQPSWFLFTSHPISAFNHTHLSALNSPSGNCIIVSFSYSVELPILLICRNSLYIMGGVLLIYGTSASRFSPTFSYDAS